jgi:hypothetical protein
VLVLGSSAEGNATSTVGYLEPHRLFDIVNTCGMGDLRVAHSPFVYRPACVADLFTGPIVVGLYSVILSAAEIGIS